MSTEPTGMHLQTDRMNASGQDKTYVAENLRGAAVMYGPAVVLDLFEGVSVLLTALGRLPDPQGSRAARILRPLAAVGRCGLLDRRGHRRGVGLTQGCELQREVDCGRSAMSTLRTCLLEQRRSTRCWYATL